MLVDRAETNVSWDDFVNRPAREGMEFFVQDNEAGATFNDQPHANINQLDQGLDAVYISPASINYQEGCLNDPNSEWLSWNNPPGLRHSVSTTVSHDPLTPGAPSFDDSRTINPDSLMNVDVDDGFSPAWSFQASKMPQEPVLSVSPTTLSQIPLQGPLPFLKDQYAPSADSAGSIPQRPHQLMPSVSSSTVSSGGDGHSFSHDDQQLQDTSSVPDDTIKPARKQSKGSNVQQRKRYRPKRAPAAHHNQIERKYRTNLNHKINLLRDSIPSLRAQVENDSETGQGPGDDDSEDESKGAGHQQRRVVKKAEIMSKATEYILELEKTIEKMARKNRALQDRLEAVEGLLASSGRRHMKQDTVSTN